MTIADNSPTFWTLAICVLLGIPASLVLGLIIARKALQAWRSGIAISSSRAEYRRAETPALYWLTLSLQAFNASACLLVTLALTALPLAYCGTTSSHQRARPQSEMSAMRAAAESYKADHGSYPTGDDAAISKALTGPNPEQKIYLEWPAKSIAPNGALLDPWGTPYRFKVGQFFDLQSAGPNKRFEDPKASNSDDISTE